MPGGASSETRSVHTSVPASTTRSADGRPVRTRAHCACDPADREQRPAVPFEHVHLRRDGTVLDVTVGTACGLCRAAVR